MDKYHETNPPTELKSVVMGRKNSRKGFTPLTTPGSKGLDEKLHSPYSPDCFWAATENWIQAVEKKYEGLDRNGLTQVFMRGPFAGMSEREVACFADRLRESATNYPIRKEDDQGNSHTSELVGHMCGLGTGTVCDSILDYLALPDCSPRTRQRIKDCLEVNAKLSDEQLINTTMPDGYQEPNEPTRAAHCSACGVEWTDHLGISGTCKKLEEVRSVIKGIRAAVGDPNL